MPTDHSRVSFTMLWVPDDAMWGVEGRGLGLGQSSCHQNRIRQAASSLRRGGLLVSRKAGEIRQVRERLRKSLADNQAIPVPPLVTAPGRDAASPDPQDGVGDG